VHLPCTTEMHASCSVGERHACVGAATPRCPPIPEGRPLPQLLAHPSSAAGAVAERKARPCASPSIPKAAAMRAYTSGGLRLAAFQPLEARERTCQASASIGWS
jgi:hypothetical protein